MSLWLHELAEAEHRILNPFTEEDLMLVGSVARLAPGMRMLDLACGKGEALCRFAARYGIRGTGVDISQVFLAEATARAAELRVSDRVEFVRADAAVYVPDPAGYQVVSCLGATWIGGGLAGTVELMRRAVDPGGLLLVGEPYWIDPPPEEAVRTLAGGDAELFTSLSGMLDRFEAAGCDLVEMVLADQHGWDRYAAAHWWTLTGWLRQHPGDPRAGQVLAFRDKERREHLAYGRRYLGWGVFVLRTDPVAVP